MENGLVKVISDWDGPILKIRIAEEAGVRTGEAIGVHYTMEEMRLVAPRYEHVFRFTEAMQAKGLTGEAARQHSDRIFHQNYLQVIEREGRNAVDERMLEVLASCTGVRYFIATMQPQYIIDKALAILGINLFHQAYGNEPPYDRLTKADIVKKAARDHGKMHLLIGDRYDEVAAGKQLGILTLHVPWGHGTPEAEQEADFLVMQHEEIAGIIAQIRKNC